MFRYLITLLAACGVAFPQQRPAFDVASVKPAANAEQGYGTERVTARPGGLTMSNVRLRTCIQWAYSVPDFLIAGPASLGDAYDYRTLPRYEIIAKAQPETPIE